MIQQRSFLTFILLTILTCGIYSLIFFYKYTEDINTICRGDGHESPNYILVMLLSIVTCGIYSYIWYYIQGNRLQAVAHRYGIEMQENGTTVLLWMFLGSLLCGIGPYVSFYILIKNINIVAEAYNSGSSNRLLQ